MLKLIDAFLTTEPLFTDQLALLVGPPSRAENRLLGVEAPKDDEWVHILAWGGQVHASAEGPRLVPSGAGGGQRVVIAKTWPGGIAGARLEYP
jgi:hypothetical protein